LFGFDKDQIIFSATKERDMTELNRILNDQDLDTLFRQARTFNAWQEKPVTDVVLQAVFDLMKMAPTSVNCSPSRFIFVKTPEAKEKLKPCLDAGNVQKTMTAPVTVIIATDFEFYNQLPKLFPHTDAKSWFSGNESLANETAIRNGTLQGGYLIMAARALGLDCGPMSGFDKQKVKEAFFPTQEKWQANFLCNLGHGSSEGLYPRSPRFDFSDICSIV
jgi:3-hydroxypropanoate dehydrogenase